MTLAKATDVAIGLLLAVIVTSLVASAVAEAIARITQKRSKDLWNTISWLVDSPALGNDPRPKPSGDNRPRRTTEALECVPPAATDSVTTALYHSPFVVDLRGTTRGAATLVNNLRSSDFARGLLWIGAQAASGRDRLLADLTTRLGSSPAAQVLEELIAETDASIERVGAGLATWFDTQMERLSRGYRRWSRWIALAVGIVIAVGANVDLVFIARTLNRNDALRAATVAEANTLVQNCQGKTGADLTKCVSDQAHVAQANQNAIQLPIGWTDPANRRFGWPDIAWKLLGWALVAVATMQGAPFWFDVLRRLMGLRSGAATPAAATASAVPA